MANYDAQLGRYSMFVCRPSHAYKNTRANPARLSKPTGSLNWKARSRLVGVRMWSDETNAHLEISLEPQDCSWGMGTRSDAHKSGKQTNEQTAGVKISSS